MIALSLLLVSLLLSVSAGLAATTYVNILTQPGQILAFWARFLYRIRDASVGTTPEEFDEGDEGPEAAQHYAERYERAEYFLKPILTCVYCVAGQMGLWLSVYVFYAYFTIFSPVLSILTAVVSVWFGGLLQYIQQRYFPL
jgi:hypothetical protein